MGCIVLLWYQKSWKFHDIGIASYIFGIVTALLSSISLHSAVCRCLSAFDPEKQNI